MDFMNLNQAAHGDRESGFIHTRMRLNRKVVVGHWQDAEVQDRIAAWMRAAAGLERLRKARSSPASATTCGRSPSPKATRSSAEIRFGYSVNGYGIGDLVKRRERGRRRRRSTSSVPEYEERYHVVAAAAQGGARHESLRDAARIELGLRAFLEAGSFKGFTTTFEDLHGLEQLPGLAVQRLMADGYGFGAEGDWKTAALVRAMKVMAAGLQGRHVVHGGLHLPPRSRRPPGAGRATCWRSASPSPPASPSLRDPSAGHRRQGRPRAAGVRRAAPGRPSTPR